MRLGTPLRTLVGLGAIVGIAAGLRAAGGFFLPVLAALFLAIVSAPLAGLLERRARVPWPLAILSAIVLDVGVLAGFVALVGTSLDGLDEALPRYQAALAGRMQELALGLSAYGVDVSVARITEVRDAGLRDFVQRLVGEAAEGAANTVLVVLLVGFLLFEARASRDKLAIVLGRASPHLEKLGHAAVEVQRYLVVKTLLCVVTGVLSGAWAAIVGVDFPLLWGLLTFVLNYVPSLGPALALAPPLAVAAITLGPAGALTFAVGHLAVGMVIGNLVEPRIVGRALGLSSLAVFVSMFFWGWMWGPLGALFAVPLTMALRTALEASEESRWLAVLLGSPGYAEAKRKEWGWADPRAASTSAPPHPGLPDAAPTATGSLKVQVAEPHKGEAAE